MNPFLYLPTPRPGVLLVLLLAIWASITTAQTEFPFAAGTDSTGLAQAQTNGRGSVLIESPEYPRGLWVRLLDESGGSLSGLQVEYQGRPDSLVEMRCFDHAGLWQETLLWIRPEGQPLRLMLRTGETSDLAAGLSYIDWRIHPSAESLLEPMEETRRMDWGSFASFFGERWGDQTGRVAVQLDGGISVVVELGYPGAIQVLIAHLREVHESSSFWIGENTSLVARVFEGDSTLQKCVILQTPLLEDPALEAVVWPGNLPPDRQTALKSAALWTQMEAEKREIHSLAGLEHFTALRRLNLFRNRITDVAPLRSLSNLWWLNLRLNEIVDIGPLASLINLRKLYLGSNQISDVGPLASLTNLTDLTLDQNPIVDVSPLASLTNLKFLFLGYNQLFDVGPLASLTNLERLHLNRNQITDVSPLTSLTSLTELILERNPVTDVGPLSLLTNLNTLWLRNIPVADVGPLGPLINLDELWLVHNQIVDLSPLARLTNLRSLQLRENPISDVGPLAGLISLNYLDLYNNMIVDVTPLASLANLRSLTLANNLIADLSSLGTLTNLNYLYLHYNRVSDVTPLATLINLEAMALEHNQIRDLSPLASLTTLGRLRLGHNEIVDVSPLAFLTGLYRLELQGNLIEDLTPLVGVDPISWTLHFLKRERRVSKPCRNPIPLTRRNSGNRWWSWYGRVVARSRWPKSSSRPGRRSATG